MAVSFCIPTHSVQSPSVSTSPAAMRWLHLPRLAALLCAAFVVKTRNSLSVCPGRKGLGWSPFPVHSQKVPLGPVLWFLGRPACRPPVLTWLRAPPA